MGGKRSAPLSKGSKRGARSSGAAPIGSCRMIYRLLADGVVLIHFLWILFLFGGGYWGRKIGIIRVFHAAGLGSALAIQILDWHCPLTHLEVWLRSREDPALAYPGSFLVFYLEKLVYLELARFWILLFTFLLLAFNLRLYLFRGKPLPP